MIPVSQAYDLYKRFAAQFSTFTIDKPEGSAHMPKVEEGLTVYNFHGTQSLANFLNFVEKNK